MIERFLPAPKWLIAALVATFGMQCLLHAQTNPPAPPVAQAPILQVPDTAAAPAETARAAVKSPNAIYKEAMHPLDVVRSSLDNWSDAELGALTVGMHRAQEACAQTRPENYTGDDLFDLARLCSFGQDWRRADTAALRYVESGAETHRAQAYALRLNALVHLESADLASRTAQEMLQKLPYDAEVAYALRYLEDYLDQAGNSVGFRLAVIEHGYLVQALQQNGPLKATRGDAVIGMGALYEWGMRLAFLQRYVGDDDGAATTVAELDAALPKSSPLSAEDQQRIDAIASQYKLLGTRLPEVNVVQSLQSPTAKARIDPNFGTATVLVLFPDWCMQCRRMMKTLTEFAVVNHDTPIHAYGLMFSANPKTSPSTHPENVKDVQGTATLVVPATTAQTFGGVEFPLGIVVDQDGLIRFIGTIPGDAFNGDGYMEKAIIRMTTTAATCREGDTRPTCRKTGSPKM